LPKNSACPQKTPPSQAERFLSEEKSQREYNRVCDVVKQVPQCRNGVGEGEIPFGRFLQGGGKGVVIGDFGVQKRAGSHFALA